MPNLTVTVAGKSYTENVPSWANKLTLHCYVGKDLFITDVSGLVAILPTFADRNIRIYAGTPPNLELYAYKLQGSDIFHYKTTRCNRCGECCRRLSQGWIYGLNGSGDCIHLVNNLCTKPEGPPIHCLGGFEQKGRCTPWSTTPINPLCVVEYLRTVAGV